jgi:hypothetical protein
MLLTLHTGIIVFTVNFQQKTSDTKFSTKPNQKMEVLEKTIKKEYPTERGKR